MSLFSLDQCNAIPVDTHVINYHDNNNNNNNNNDNNISSKVWSIAIRDYNLSDLAVKSLTPIVYETIGETFRSIFGEKAGWAHSVLFAGN